MTNSKPFYNSDNETKIRIRAASYHLETELFDLTLPGTYVGDVWMPKPQYIKESQKYAREKMTLCKSGLSSDEMKKFQLYMKEYASYSVDRLKFEVEELKKMTNDQQTQLSLAN